MVSLSFVKIWSSGLSVIHQQHSGGIICREFAYIVLCL